jgi:hypothetical protein
MIRGTSAGGLIAIMLCRLQMTTDERINAYISLSDKFFEKETHWVNVSNRHQSSHQLALLRSLDFPDLTVQLSDIDNRDLTIANGYSRPTTADTCRTTIGAHL